MLTERFVFIGASACMWTSDSAESPEEKLPCGDGRREMALGVDWAGGEGGWQR